MDYGEVDSIMSRRNLANEIAFDALTIAIEPTPNLDGCPLGLYYPDDAIVIIPPTALEGTLLHELGHRHGHYYYNDLSEDYAEYFRRIYQPKGKVLLYQGNHFENLPKFGGLFQEGEKGAVEIALLRPLTQDELYQIKSQLDGYGEAIPKLCCGNSEIPWVRFEFTKGVDWMVVIGASMAASVLLTVGALGYAVYKVSAELPWIIPVSALGTGMFLLLRAMAKEARVRA